MASVQAFKTLQLGQYHDLFLKENSRADGRHFDQFRDVILSKNTIDSSDGSCLAKLGNTTVVAGIKATLTAPSSDEPKAGILNISVDLPPICINSQRFKENRQGTNDESQTVGKRISDVIKDAGCFPLEQLCVEEGKAVWQLDLQAICLDFDGNYQDALLIAIVAALAGASVPEVKLKEDKDDVEFLDTKRKLEIASCPIGCLFATLSDNVIIADPTYEEEQLATGFVQIVWDSNSNSMVSIAKDGGTGLEDEQFQRLFDKSMSRAAQIVKLIKSK